VKRMPGDIWAIFAGTLGNNYDIPTVLLAAKKLWELKIPMKIFIAGEGPLQKYLCKFIDENHLDNVVFLGRLSFNELRSCYKHFDIGLAPYTKSSTVAMPVKIYDYFCAGLLVVNSLDGELEE